MLRKHNPHRSPNVVNPPAGGSSCLWKHAAGGHLFLFVVAQYVRGKRGGIPVGPASPDFPELCGGFRGIFGSVPFALCLLMVAHRGFGISISK